MFNRQIILRFSLLNACNAFSRLRLRMRSWLLRSNCRFNRNCRRLRREWVVGGGWWVDGCWWWNRTWCRLHLRLNRCLASRNLICLIRRRGTASNCKNYKKNHHKSYNHLFHEHHHLNAFSLCTECTHSFFSIKASRAHQGSAQRTIDRADSLFTSHTDCKAFHKSHIKGSAFL